MKNCSQKDEKTYICFYPFYHLPSEFITINSFQNGGASPYEESSLWFLVLNLSTTDFGNYAYNSSHHHFLGHHSFSIGMRSPYVNDFILILFLFSVYNLLLQDFCWQTNLWIHQRTCDSSHLNWKLIQILSHLWAIIFDCQINPERQVWIPFIFALSREL